MDELSQLRDGSGESPHVFLPVEIIEEIIKYAITNLHTPTHALPRQSSALSYSLEPGIGEIADRTCTLCPMVNLRNWAMVNRLWNQVVTPYLYGRIDLHMLAIPARYVSRPIVFKRRVLDSGGWERGLVWAVGSAKELGQVEYLPDTPSARDITVRTRKMEVGSEEKQRIESTARQVWPQRSFDELEAIGADERYIVEYQFVSKDLIGGMNSSGPVFNKNAVPAKVYVPAPIRLPRDCCDSSWHHHNYFPEWYSLGYHWDDARGYLEGETNVRQMNPITDYLLNRVLMPLIRTLEYRPDLAHMVRSIQLPLQVYEEFMSGAALKQSFWKYDDCGNVIETHKEDPNAQGNDLYALLLTLILRLAKVCPNLENVESDWNMTALAEKFCPLRPKKVEPTPDKKDFDVPPFPMKLHHQFSRSSGTQPQPEAHNQPEHSNDCGSLFAEIRKVRADLWQALILTLLPKLTDWKLDYLPKQNAPKPNSRFRSDVEVCFAKHSMAAFQIQQRNRIRRRERSAIKIEQLHTYLPVVLGCRTSVSPYAGAKLRHLELSAWQDDSPFSLGSQLIDDVKRALESALRGHGFPNLDSLSLTQGYTSILDIVPANKLQTLKITRWYILEPVMDYLYRCHITTSSTRPSALQNLTLDIVSCKLALGVDDTAFPYSTVMCIEERREESLMVHQLYNILQFSPNLRNLVLRRGRFENDMLWKMALIDKCLNWHAEQESLVGEEYLPMTHGLESLSLYSWGRPLRDWLLMVLSSSGHEDPSSSPRTNSEDNPSFSLSTTLPLFTLPHLRKISYTSSISEYRIIRRHRSMPQYSTEACLSTGGSGLEDCLFCGWGRENELDVRNVGVDYYYSSSRKMQTGEGLAREEDQRILDVARRRGVKIDSEEAMQMEDWPLWRCPRGHPFRSGLWGKWLQECQYHMWTEREIEGDGVVLESDVDVDIQNISRMYR